MSARGMSAANIADLSKDGVKMYHLVSIALSSTEYFTTAPIDITYGGNTYVSSGRFVSIGNITENLMPRVGTTTINMSGVDSTNISLVLTENFIDAAVNISIAILNSDDSLNFAIDHFKGTIKSFSFSEDPKSGTANLSWEVASHWADFEKTAGSYANNKDQQRTYPNDTFFTFADKTLTDIKWGKQ